MVLERVSKVLITEDIETPRKKYTKKTMALMMGYTSTFNITPSVRELMIQKYLEEKPKGVYYLSPSLFP